MSILNIISQQALAISVFSTANPTATCRFFSELLSSVDRASWLISTKAQHPAKDLEQAANERQREFTGRLLIESVKRGRKSFSDRYIYIYIATKMPFSALIRCNSNNEV